MERYRYVDHRTGKTVMDPPVPSDPLPKRPRHELETALRRIQVALKSDDPISAIYEALERLNK